jgi:hypothetical protein
MVRINKAKIKAIFQINSMLEIDLLKHVLINKLCTSCAHAATAKHKQDKLFCSQYMMYVNSDEWCKDHEYL